LILIPFFQGNLGRVDYISDFEYDLFIRPDTCNAKFRIWFNFTVENVKSDQRVIFNVVNFSKSKSLYREGMSPLVKSTSRPKWQRIPPKNCFYYRCPEHKKNYVMSFVFCFDVEDDVYQFAYSFPYSYTKLQNYMQLLEKRDMNYFERELLTMSVQQRRLDLLTVCDPQLKQPSEKKRKIVAITARVHPGESPSSYVCHGFIDFIVSNHPIAKVLRENIIFKIIPMLNPDGVYLGNYRCSLMGFDLNRVWQDPSPWAHPELFATKAQVLSFDKSPTNDLDFFIDIHAHSTMMNGFMYGNIYEDSNRYERQAIFPKLLCSNANDFSMSNTSFNKDAVKAGTGRRTLGGSLDENCYCYTLEVSFFSYQPVGFTYPIPYTEEEYMKLGRNLGRTFLDYYKLQNLIIINPTTSISMTPKVSSFDLNQNKNQSTSTNSNNNNNNSSASLISNNDSSSGNLTSNNSNIKRNVNSSQALKPLSSLKLDELTTTNNNYDNKSDSSESMIKPFNKFYIDESDN
jgi:cytosolic carboxypeptidase protein 6